MADTVVIKFALQGIGADNINSVLNLSGWEEYSDAEKIAALLGLSALDAPALLVLPTDEKGVRSKAFDGQILDIRVENRREFDEEVEV